MAKRIYDVEATEELRIAEGRKIRSFTDISGRIGTRNIRAPEEVGIEPSRWERAPVEPYRKRPALEPTIPKIGKVKAVGAVGKPVTKDRFKDRELFGKFLVDQKIGYDPFLINPEEEVDRAQAELPAMFEQTFGFLMRDEASLDPNQKKWWAKTKKDFNVHVKDTATAKREIGIERWERGMKGFADFQSEIKLLSDDVETSLESIYISVDKDGMETGKIPKGELASTIKTAGDLMYGGTPRFEAVERVTKDIINKQFRQTDIGEKLDAIPEINRSAYTRLPKNIDATKTAIKEAIKARATDKDIKSRLKDQGWDDVNIAEMLQEDKILQPGAEPAGLPDLTPEENTELVELLIKFKKSGGSKEEIMGEKDAKSLLETLRKSVPAGKVHEVAVEKKPEAKKEPVIVKKKVPTDQKIRERPKPEVSKKTSARVKKEKKIIRDFKGQKIPDFVFKEGFFDIAESDIAEIVGKLPDMDLDKWYRKILMGGMKRTRPE